MCGIAGLVNLSYQDVPRTFLEKMQSSLLERGPDAQGIYAKAFWGLAHTRLSIVDLSPSGNQPMVDLKTQNVICFNGEIYNFLQLKEELLQNGYTFSSTSDTEVLLKGYDFWGIELLLKKLEGMFAFGLVDAEKQEIFLCRDRFGQKPLYYYQDSNFFAFASEIRAFKELGFSFQMDLESVDYYLSELAVPQPKSIFQEVRQVEPAHYLSWNLKTHKKQVIPYWVLNFQPNNHLNEADTLDLLEEKLKSAVGKRLHGDVPVGCFLSGGVDSGLVTALLATHSPKPIHSYTVGFDYQPFDESQDAKNLAQRYGTQHTELILKSDILDQLPDLIAYFGEPFADSSMIPTYLISQEIGKQIKVALTGDGGDEMFGGYYEYGFAYETQQYLAEYSNPFSKKISTVSSKIFSRINPQIKNLGNLETYANYTGSNWLNRKMGFSTVQKDSLYHPDVHSQVAHYTDAYLNKVWQLSEESSLVKTLFKASLSTRLLNDYLVKIDRASMKNSIELRSPFMDHCLFEFAATIPDDILLKGGIPKYLLKKMAQKYIAPDIMTKKKQGFSIPLHKWIKGRFNPLIKEVLSASNIQKRGWFEAPYIEKILQEHAANKQDHTHRIWALFCLELWLQQVWD